MGNDLPRSDDEWRTVLTPEQYRILRNKGTEAPFTNEFYGHKDDGTYVCGGCGASLFSSNKKYDSGSGWPSFTTPVDATSVSQNTDLETGTPRIEVLCKTCDGHLGHVFDDGPREQGGKRYCINSGALTFRPDK